ncbi:sirohydrochlorin cobaltochelatase [Spirochaeta cellobiosiphila]|uniref:sirohydrochlorin cobaltochelatase n=1 Tax=Spirochaeta cellobiosiphila TaxID=504483 RepID=UPI000411C216|nr:sirohydrochlorin cobaltochelatase [Spirochaeta cellobiosiphila]
MSSCQSNKYTSSNKEKPVIVIAAFGSSYESGQKNLEDFDIAMRKAFPHNEVTWGFTSSFIVKKLLKQGKTTLFASEVPIRKIDQTLEDLSLVGKKNIVIINFLLMVGSEYRQVMTSHSSELNIKYVHPLLYYPENMPKIIKALESEFGDKDELTVICAHGNEKHPEYNKDFVQMNNYLKEHYSHSYVAVMEGNPEFEEVKEVAQKNDFKAVRFIAFMLTYGDHMSNDVMGEEEDSWKNQLGLPATATGGLASITPIQKIFIDKTKSAIKEF